MIYGSLSGSDEQNYPVRTYSSAITVIGFVMRAYKRLSVIIRRQARVSGEAAVANIHGFIIDTRRAKMNNARGVIYRR